MGGNGAAQGGCCAEEGARTGAVTAGARSVIEGVGHGGEEEETPWAAGGEHRLGDFLRHEQGGNAMEDLTSTHHQS
jgi:hypothetical protein